MFQNAIFSIFFEGGSLPPGCFLIGLPQKIGKIHDHGATPDVQIPGLLHDLLVDDGSVGPHDNAPLLGIDLCIQQGIPDKINDPPLGVLLIHGKLLAERIQINLVTNPTRLSKTKTLASPMNKAVWLQRKKSVARTASHSASFPCASSKSNLTQRQSTNSTMGSV